MITLESKASAATRQLARKLISVDPGQQLPRTQDLAQELSVGFGTVEKAVSALKSAGAIQARARGQMGTFLEGRDLRQLWEIAGCGMVFGLLPLPNAITFLGLASGATAWLRDIGIPFSLNFKNGARARVEALMEGRADFILLSKRSADIVLKEQPETQTIAELPAWTYYTGHEVVYHRDLDKPRQEWVVGVDSSSYDHVALCKAHFPASPEKEVKYVHLPYAIANGEVDATLLHSRSLVPMDLVQELATEQVSSSNVVLQSSSAAVLLCRRDADALAGIVRSSDSTHIIADIQRAVVEGTREPEY